MTGKIKQYLLIIIGLTSLVLGAIGVVLPILPTTPFLLLSAYCFARSSRKLSDWLMNNRIFGSYIKNYLTYKAISRRTKITAIAILWITLGISISFTGIIYAKVAMCVAGIAASTYLLGLKELKST